MVSLLIDLVVNTCINTVVVLQPEHISTFAAQIITSQKVAKSYNDSHCCVHLHVLMSKLLL